MALLEDILALAKKGPEGLDESDRVALLQAAEKLAVALENPLEKWMRLFVVGISSCHTVRSILFLCSSILGTELTMKVTLRPSRNPPSCRPEPLRHRTRPQWPHHRRRAGREEQSRC